MSPSERIIRIIELATAINHEMALLKGAADIRLYNHTGVISLHADHPMKVYSVLL